jgi:hypothetical protein
MAAIRIASVEEWDPRIHGERRRAASRRRNAADTPDGSHPSDDRRFGLGRRWEDWCRSAAVIDRRAAA